MAHAPLFSILPIHPTLPGFRLPPLTLAQVQQMVVQPEHGPLLQDVTVDDISSNGGRRLLEFLAHMSAKHNTVHFMCPDEIEPARLNDLVNALNKNSFGLRMSLACSITQSIPSHLGKMDYYGGIVQIQWRVSTQLPAMGFFKTASQAGVWNHVRFHGAGASRENCIAVAGQPNIVHSWETTQTDQPSSMYNPIYGGSRPLSGRPLWRALKNAASRFLLADALTKEQLLRLRIDEDGKRIYSVGENLDYHFVSPDRLPGGYLDEICAMVAAGGTVATTHVRSNLQRAHLIGYVEENGVIVGNSSLKNPRPEYIKTVHRQSGLNLSGYVERGYTSVRPEYRGLGIGTRLLEGLTRRAGDRKIFSVISEDNTATQTIAIRNRTRKVATYYSQKAGKPVGIWMPEWMIETGNGEKA